MKNKFVNIIRYLLMPGTNLFSRRRVTLKKYWLNGKRNVLDAGSGNGWFSYLAYKSGAIVTAVNISEDQITKAKEFYNKWLGIEEKKLNFITLNLYNLMEIEDKFDEIICYETLEHIKDDKLVCKYFWDLLNKNGVLHICCPYSEHERWINDRIDVDETGYHVRPGYTLNSYKELLEPIGFEIEEVEGMGNELMVKYHLLLQKLQKILGNIFIIPLSFLAFPLVWTDGNNLNYPYSIYIKAVKKNKI